MKKIGVAFLIAAACFVLSLLSFAPRFYLWEIDNNFRFPENNRTGLELLQIEDPFTTLPGASNRYLEWRLLFPYLAHVLKLPATFFFAIPYIFCFLLLWYTAHLSADRTKSRGITVALTLLIATCGSFFTSIGFLGYFDSALLLGLIVGSFSKNNLLIWCAMALTPWIDDRAIFALPIVFFCQWSLSGKFSKIIPILLGVVPYIALRIFAVTSGGDETSGELGRILKSPHQAIWLTFGFWDGLRWGWLLCLPAIFSGTALQKIFALTIIPVTLALLLLAAGDYSRSMSVAAPLMILGCILLNNLAQKNSKDIIEVTPWLIYGFLAIVAALAVVYTPLEQTQILIAAALIIYISWTSQTRKLQKQKLATASVIFFSLCIATLNLLTPAAHTFRAFHTLIQPLSIQIETAQQLSHRTLKK